MPDRLLEEFGVGTHPEAEKLVVPKWDAPGRCICGAELPPMSKWKNPGGQWSSIECGSCGRGFVDEEDYIAIYDDGLDPEGPDSR